MIHRPIIIYNLKNVIYYRIINYLEESNNLLLIFQHYECKKGF